ncbi:MAG: hypothetical protein V4539_03695 [Bacteroidota bacterium]
MFNESSIINPFPGLRAFEEDEDILFFGREKQVDELLTKLRTTRFLAVIGSSGSGKSSLIKSGLIPSLHSGFMSGAGSLWRICSFRPGNDPIHNMAEGLSQPNVLYTNLQSEDEIATYISINESILRRSSTGLAAAYKQSGIDPKQNLLVLVDQFEELFRFSKYEKSEKEGKRDAVAFINLLLKATEQRDVPVYVVFTMRSDFLGDCTEFRGLPEAINSGDYLVPRMTREERKEAIVAPISVAGAAIAPRLVNQLLNDVGDNPDQLPILQHALMRTWDIWKQKNHPETPIDIDDYEEIGTMKHALSQHAEEAYAELVTPRQKMICKALFKALTDRGSDSRGIRRPTRLSEVAELANAPVEELVQVVEIFRKPGRSFLMPPANIPLTKDTIIDISHESLMRVWERLIEWVEEETQSAEAYLRLCEATTMYQLGSGGLLRNPELDIAQKWQAQNAPNATWAKRYNPNFESAISFLQYSKGQLDFEIEQKELQQRKRIKRARIIAVVLGSAAMVCLIFLIVALNLKFKAEESEKEAIKSRLAAVAQSKEAERQKNIATQEKQRAEDQKTVAEKQTILAEEQTSIAKQEKNKANQEKQNALFQRGVAEKATVVAVSAKNEAEQRKKEAEEQTTIAKNERSIADRERLKSETSEKNTRRLRLLALSRSLANQAVREYNSHNLDLARLLAAQAYAFNKENDGNEYVPEIFTALSTVTENQKVHVDFGSGVRALAVSANNLLAAGDESGSIRLWASGVAGGKSKEYKLKPLQPGGNNVRAISFSKDNKKIAVGTRSGHVYIFATDNFPVTPVAIKVHNGPVTDIVFADSDNSLYTSSDDSTVRKSNISAAAQNSVIIEKASGRIMNIRLSPNQDKLVAAEETGKLLLLDKLNTTQISRSEILIVKELLKSVEFSKDGRYLACGTADGNIFLFESAKQYANPQKFKAHLSPVYAISFKDDNSLLATGAGNGEIKLWRTNNLLVEPLLLTGNDSWVWDIRFSSNGNTLIAAGADKSVRTWSFNQEQLKKQNCETIKRGFTAGEWRTYIGDDIAQKDVCNNP